MRNAALAVATCIAMLGCAVQPRMDFDYDTKVDFSTLKTYDWTPASGNAAADELLVSRIRNAVDSQLQAKGRAPAAGQSDFLIALQLSGKTVHGGSVGAGISFGIPVGNAGRISVGGGKSRPIEKKEGTLVLEFLDAKTKSLVWRGTASGAVQPVASPEEQQQRIDKVIAELLARFPPNTEKGKG
jgi:Domain of unknown function (DUF4136)